MMWCVVITEPDMDWYDVSGGVELKFLSVRSLLSLCSEVNTVTVLYHLWYMNICFSSLLPWGVVIFFKDKKGCVQYRLNTDDALRSVMPLLQIPWCFAFKQQHWKVTVIINWTGHKQIFESSRGNGVWVLLKIKMPRLLWWSWIILGAAAMFKSFLTPGICV